jgi:glucosylceramidase
VIVDPDADEVYFTPLYYTMSHFSRYIRPGAVRIGHSHDNDQLQLTAVKNPDGSVVVVMLNETEEPMNISIELEGKVRELAIDGKAVQTVLL